MKVRLCPCGTRLRQNQKMYCSNQCRGRYHNYGPVKRGFDIEVPKNRDRIPVGPGFAGYLFSRAE